MFHLCLFEPSHTYRPWGRVILFCAENKDAGFHPAGDTSDGMLNLMYIDVYNLST